jgi:hypothetical protein
MELADEFDGGQAVLDALSNLRFFADLRSRGRQTAGCLTAHPPGRAVAEGLAGG